MKSRCISHFTPCFLRGKTNAFEVITIYMLAYSIEMV
jgi:hypothetical protein